MGSVRCERPESHDPHEHAIRAGGITVAGGRCEGEALPITAGDHVTAVDDAPGRFSRYVGMVGLVLDVDNGILDVLWTPDVRDWIGVDHVRPVR